MGCQIRRHWRREFCSRSIHPAPWLRPNPPKLAPVFAAPDTQSPNVTAAKMRDLAEGGYIDLDELVLFIGERDPETFCTSLLHR